MSNDDCARSAARALAVHAWYGLLASMTLTLAAAVDGRALAQAAGPAPSKASNADTLPMCTTDARLSGAMYDATHPERSFALFKVGASRKGEVYRAGMRIGTFELIAIEPRGVLLRGPEGECWLRLVSSPDRPRRASTPPLKKKRARKSGKTN
jgi:hypothetical protein